MEAGDVIVFPHGDLHTMRSHDGTKTTPIGSVFSPGSGDELPQVFFGGGGRHPVSFAATCIATALQSAGRFAADDAAGAQPRRYAASRPSTSAANSPRRCREAAGTWLGTTLKFTINEARAARPGNAAMLGRLTELMFVEICASTCSSFLPTTAAGSPG